MAGKEIFGNARIKYRSDTLNAWNENNPVLLSGEFGVVTGLNSVGDGLENESRKVKIGDGIHNWKELQWWNDFTVDQSYSPESENPQSGVAIEERLKSKVLLDITLTEEQAGASSVMVAIPNCELLKKAKQWNLQIKFPYFKEYAANTLWFNVGIQNETATAYNGILGNGYTIKFPLTYSENENYGYWNLTIFNTKYEDESGMVASYYLRPHPWAFASANSAEHIRGCNWSYFHYAMTNNYPPFLKLWNSSDFIFEAGTRIFLEVVL